MNNQMLDSNGSDVDPQPRNKTQIKESKFPENKENQEAWMPEMSHEKKKKRKWKDEVP